MEPIINPTEDQLNEWLSRQTIRGTIGRNRLADLALDPQQIMAMQQDNMAGGDQGVQFAQTPQNYIRSPSGEVIPLQSIQQQGGMSLNDLLNKTGASIQDKVVLSDRGVGYRTPYGSVAGLDSAGRMWEVDKPRTPTITPQQMTAYYQMLKAKQEVEGGAKPQLVDGQWIYPPSAQAPQGKAIPVEGFQKETKPPTDEQSKASGFFERAVTASTILDTIGGGESGRPGSVQPGIIKRTLSGIPSAVGLERMGEAVGTLANFTQSAPQQQVEQAQRDFVNSILRRESGAVISQQEFDNAAKQYFPQPGDTQQVIAQKSKNRANALSALETASGQSPVVVKKIQGAKAQGQALIDAYDAIRRGADRNAVRERLEQMGITYHGIR